MHSGDDEDAEIDDNDDNIGNSDNNSSGAAVQFVLSSIGYKFANLLEPNDNIIWSAVCTGTVGKNS